MPFYETGELPGCRAPRNRWPASAAFRPRIGHMRQSSRTSARRSIGIRARSIRVGVQARPAPLPLRPQTPGSTQVSGRFCLQLQLEVPLLDGGAAPQGGRSLTTWIANVPGCGAPARGSSFACASSSAARQMRAWCSTAAHEHAMLEVRVRIPAPAPSSSDSACVLRVCCPMNMQRTCGGAA